MSLKDMIAAAIMMVTFALLILLVSGCGKRDDNKQKPDGSVVFMQCSAIAYDFACCDYTSTYPLPMHDFYDRGCFDQYQFCINNGGMWPALQPHRARYSRRRL